MITQKVAAKSVTPLRGLIIVAAIAAALMLGSLLGRVLANNFGQIFGQITLLVIAGAAAFYIMRNVVVEYQYTVSGEIFYIERVYGKRSKVMIQIPVGDILYVGPREKALEKWPEAKNMITATVNGEANPIVVIAYRSKGLMCLANVQPNDEIKNALFDVEKRARSAKEKWGE